MYCMAVGRDKPPGLYLALSKLYTYLCKVDQSMALHCFSLFADGRAYTPSSTIVARYVESNVARTMAVQLHELRQGVLASY